VLPNEVQWGAVGGIIVAFIAGVFTWFTQRSKGRVDESVAAIAEWQKLTSTLTADNGALRAELAATDKAHVEELADIRHRHDAEMKAMRTMNENLMRLIAQNSQSRAQLIGNLDEGSGGK
jgi:hypothetical protein